MSPIAKRRRPSGEGNDLISSLPVHLIACILDFMPIEEAARTSILSKTWKNIWLSRSHVDLGRKFCHQLYLNSFTLLEDSPSKQVVQSRILNAVDKILLAHQGPIFKFCLFIPLNIDVRPHYNSWMSLLSTKGVEHLELWNFTENPINPMPSHLFYYFSKLLSLRLANYILDPPPDYRGFRNLTSVYLIHVRFDADMSFGPQLNELSLVRCVGIHHLGLQFTHHNKNLNKLALWRADLLETFDAIFIHDKDPVSSIKECIDMSSFLSSTPNMATLILNGFCLGLMDPRPTIATRPMEKMKTLVLYNVDFYDMQQISNVLSLIASSPNLEYLQILVGRQAMRENPEVERYLGTWWKTFVLNQLHTVEIGETVRSRHGLLFIQLLYASSPSLKRLRWCPFTVGGISIEEFDRNSNSCGVLQMLGL